MNRMAVDVVLLPDTAMEEKALALNRSLVEKCNSDIVLDPANCLPHVTLAMGCMQSRDLGAVAGELDAIGQSHAVKWLFVKQVNSQAHHGCSIVSSIELQAREDLQQLHVRIMGNLAPYFNYHVTESMFAGAHPIAASTLNWVKNFPQQSSGDKFRPHITLGYGVCEPVGLPPSFAPRALALCHLGNHCTCREVLYSVACEQAHMEFGVSRQKEM